MINYVTTQLERELSPDQIVETAKLNGINCVSHERIYKYVWAKKKRGAIA